MIYYFSGTGNSRTAAEALASATGEDLRFIPHCSPYVQTADNSRSLGFVFPVYAWGVPPLVMDFIARLPQTMIEDIIDRNIKVWTVAVCGDETGKAVNMLCKALAKRGITLSGAWSLIMPNVYVLLPGFGVDRKEIENKKLSDARGRIDEISDHIIRNDWTFDVHEGGIPLLKTSIVYPLFCRMGVNTRRWHSEERCISCGKCASECPVGNISMSSGAPHWGTACTSCCACFHACPVNAVQYGSVTRKLGQYRPDKTIFENLSKKMVSHQ